MRILLLGQAALAAAGILATMASAGAPSKTLVHGLVVLSPDKPVCRRGERCARPFPGLELAFAKRGTVVARTTTNSTGGYRVRLAPGTYAVTTPKRKLGSGIQPNRIVVPAARSVTRNFTYDAGIR